MHPDTGIRHSCYILPRKRLYKTPRYLSPLGSLWKPKRFDWSIFDHFWSRHGRRKEPVEERLRWASKSHWLPRLMEECARLVAETPWDVWRMHCECHSEGGLFHLPTTAAFPCVPQPCQVLAVPARQLGASHRQLGASQRWFLGNFPNILWRLIHIVSYYADGCIQKCCLGLYPVWICQKPHQAYPQNQATWLTTLNWPGRSGIDWQLETSRLLGGLRKALMGSKMEEFSARIDQDWAGNIFH